MASRRQKVLNIAGITIVMLTTALIVFTLAVPMGQTTPTPASAEIEINPGLRRLRTAQNPNPAAPTVGPAKAAVAPPEIIQDQWQVITLENQRVGFSHTKAEKHFGDNQEFVRTTTEEKMKIKRSGDPLEITVKLSTDEMSDGSMLSYELQIANPPAAPTRAVGRVVGNRLDIETTVAGGTRKTSIPWRVDVKSPAWQDRLLRDTQLQPGQHLKYETFSPEFNRIASVMLNVDDLREVKLLDRSRNSFLRIRAINSITPESPITLFVDTHGQVVKTETLMLGKQLATYTVSAEEALKEISGDGFDIGVATLIGVDPPLRMGHRTRKAVYRITIPGKDPSKYFVEGPTQKIRKVNNEMIELTVSSLAIPKEPKRIAGSEEYLKPTRFLQSDDPKVVAHARAAANGRIDHGVLAAIMERYVLRKLAKKNFSTAMASAAEVAETLSGDCTEHAVLLAAMLRARQIPSRIAIGLVYLEGPNAFGGHMWTEAWIDGQWIPLDATLGRGGIGAAHLKMTDSSFADDAPAPFASFLPLIEVLGQMKIEVVSAE